MRKITTGVQGGPILGALRAINNNIATLEPDENIVLDPDGTGIVEVNSHLVLNTASTLRFGDGDTSNFVGLKAPATVASDFTLTLPAADGTANFVLQTNGTGTLGWAELSVAVANATDADATSYFPAMTTATTGRINGITVKNNRFTFQPSTGTLTTPICSHTSGTITTLSSTTGNITTVNATNLNATTITETSSIALKENISPITDALDQITKLVGVTYDRKDGSSKNEPGLIAEEVEKIIPNLITYKDGKPDGIQYTKLTAYLIEAVKTLAEEVKELRNK